MPGMYEENVYDLAGFSLGIVENSQLLPRISDVQVGDIIIALPSNGIHSNGFSLVHKVMKFVNASLYDPAPFSASNKSFADELLSPTKIYVPAVLPVLRTGLVKAIAHITGKQSFHTIQKHIYLIVHSLYLQVADLLKILHASSLRI